MELSLETLSLKQLQGKWSIQRIKDYEAKLKEIEIDRAMELEAALTATNDESNLSNLQLDNDEEEGEGELVDILNGNSESPTKSNTSSEITYEKEENSNKRRDIKTYG